MAVLCVHVHIDQGLGREEAKVAVPSVVVIMVVVVLMMKTMMKTTKIKMMAVGHMRGTYCCCKGNAPQLVRLVVKGFGKICRARHTSMLQVTQAV